MNKKFSTLLCGALALFTFSANAQTWMKIQTEDGSELVKKGDSVVVVAAGAAETKTAASLWSVEVVARETSGNKIYQFTNKATNTTLKLKNNDIFAVGKKDSVNHQLDTLTTSSAATNYKSLFTVEGGFTIVAKANGTITPDTGSYASFLTPLKVILAKPGDMTHWMTVAELNQCATYSVPLFAAMEGVAVADAAYEFVSTADSVTSADTVFTVQSKTSGKYLAVDSANVTKSSTVNLTNQDPVFGFDVKFGGNATKYKNFGIKFNPVNDSIAVAVMDSTLAWDVTSKAIAGDTVALGQPVAWLGNVQFVNDKAEYITVDDLDAPTNGKPYWSPAPAQIEAGEPLADGLYILQSKNGIWGYEFETTCDPVGNRENTLKNELLPENQWMIKGTFEDGIYSYKTWNRFYSIDTTEIKRVSTCDEDYFIFGTDTVSVKAIEANYGYKVFDGEALDASSFTLGLVNKLGANSAYMIMNADSSLNVLATEEPLEFRAKYDRGASFNGKTFATDTVAVYNLYTLNAKGDTLWVGTNASLNVVSETLSTKKTATPTGFVFKMINEGEYMMISAELAGTCCDTTAVRVHENGGTTAFTDVTYNDVSLFTINQKFDDSEYARLEAGHYLIIDNSKGNAESGELDENEVLTKNANKAAKFLSVGDKLGDEAAIEENFSLWIEEACVNNTPADTLFPTYYILKGATVDADTVRGDFLTAKGKYTATGDSLMTFVTGKAKINDKMAKAKAAANTFLFKVTDVENQYTIQSAKNRAESLALINGTVVLTKSKIALPVVVAKTSVVPTANENIAAEGVTVIAGNGQITIAGAAGKKVVIANILGQTVANTIIASDNATIAAPAGVVVVKVEGEAAVKAIVK